MAGVFDLTVVEHGRIAWVEFKGYSGKKRRSAGRLSQPQIDWGNRMTRMGFSVASFFDPVAAWTWLRGIGFNVGDIK